MVSSDRALIGQISKSSLLQYFAGSDFPIAIVQDNMLKLDFERQQRSLVWLRVLAVYLLLLFSWRGRSSETSRSNTRSGINRAIKINFPTVINSPWLLIIRSESRTEGEMRLSS